MAEATDHQETESRPALVLGGGGAYGLIQAAHILAAWEAGFRPSIVIGTSVGSLNGAWLAMHPDRPEDLLRIWLGLDQLRVVKLSPLALATKLIRTPSAIAHNNVVPALLDRHLRGASFETTEIPLAVVSTNLLRGVKHVFHSGSLRQAILASTAIPGVFDPVEIDGELFVDGCLTASVDIATAVAMGATEVLAIDLTPPPASRRPKTAVGVLRQSLAIMSHATTDAMEACVRRQMPVRVIRPDLSRSSPWKLEDSAGAVAHNLRLAREATHGVIDSDGHVAVSVGLDAGPAGARTEPVQLTRFFHPRAVKKRA